MTSEGSGGWTFLTNHAHVLLCIAREPDVRLRDVAERVRITERAAQRIVRELVDAGYLERRRVGRRNRYVIHPERPLRHPLERGHAIAELLVALDALSTRSVSKLREQSLPAASRGTQTGASGSVRVRG